MSSEDSTDAGISSNPFAMFILILFGIILLVYMLSNLIKQALNTCRQRLLSYVMAEYWRKVAEKHKEELDNFFQPLRMKKKEISENLDVLEIGIGDGANFPHYPEGCNVYALDLEDIYEVAVKKNIKKYLHLTLKKFYCSPAEDMSFIKTGTVDVVISTMCLCSVGDVEKVLNEIKRVLRKGGIFIYWEHVEATSSTIKFFQVLLHGSWKCMFGNCHLTRRPWETVESTGFATQKYTKVTVDTLPLISTTLVGSATK
ncbi:thiol S-methyltransferase METTL7B [Octopus bimaculoides]|uniref:Methyltransferase type 11 domain-containing protein n=1 Tax=Octopus bimaculoides TaxID=37653 RepID=A0A0L8HX08_OCTBM|nr:thiol S-methyltransferase METTL7B [Octopus bimaculoides]|eukprot:XP_014768656.1 PREDICTED: methyltransferase-like protein 7B [Octopus bimaculoides]